MTQPNPTFDIRFVTAAYADRRITLRESGDNWVDIEGHYENGAHVFRLDGDRYRSALRFKFVLDATTYMDGYDLETQPEPGQGCSYNEDSVKFIFRIRFVTATYAHRQLTLRTSADWSVDITGHYDDESRAHEFELDAAHYPSDVRIRFVLDGTTVMDGHALELEPEPGGHSYYGEDQVRFPDNQPAARLPPPSSNRSAVLPGNTDPSVKITPLSGPVPVGVPFVITGTTDGGRSQAKAPPGQPPPPPEAVAAFTGVVVTMDTGETATATSTSPATSEWATWSATLSTVRPGAHTATATGSANNAVNNSPIPSITSAPVSFSTEGAPEVTITEPLANVSVGLQETGADIAVMVTTSDVGLYGGPSVLGIPRGLTLKAQTDSGTYDLSLAPGSTTQWTSGAPPNSPVRLGPMPLGARSISLTCMPLVAPQLATTVTVTVVGEDVAPPQLYVDSPLPAADVPADSTTGIALVHMVGRAVDGQSGMIGGHATVEWALTADGARTAAQTTNGFATWTADVPLTSLGNHTIYVWATDASGNQVTSPVIVPVVVVSDYTPPTLEDRLDEREYLKSLLGFTSDVITVGSAGPVTTEQVAAVLGQPLGRLSEPIGLTVEVAKAEINELRVPVELLRGYIAVKKLPEAPGADAETAYRAAAYNAVLVGAGTSYAELRLARGAPSAQRQKLASRLGIMLTSGGSRDELEQLTLGLATLTEDSLETLFGLPATSSDNDPLRTLPTPLLLIWQQNAQQRTWAAEDQNPTAPRSFSVLVDPDVISTADITSGPPGDPARQLLTARTAELTAYAQQLDAARTSAPDPHAGLAAMMTIVLPTVDLTALQAAENGGADISTDLAAAGLTRAGYLYLQHVTLLAGTPTVTDEEWVDTTAVLVRAHKQTLLPTWRSQETAIVLSPTIFTLADPGPTVNPYRVDPQDRLDWQAVLRNRISQSQTLVDGLAGNVAAAEQLTLPLLLHALLTDVAAASSGDAGEAMTTLFQLDFKASGTVRTSRLDKATEAVQSLLLALRSGELPPTHPAATWQVNVEAPTFDARWAWLGTLGSWQTATRIYLFPEQNLDPILLAGTAPFSSLCTAVTNAGVASKTGLPFTAADAAKAANDYLTAMIQSPPSTLGPLSQANPDVALFTYLDPQRSSLHQDDLYRIGLELAGRQDLADEVFWAVPLIFAQRLQAAGQYLDALDWYWILLPFSISARVSSISVTITNELTETINPPDLRFPANWTDDLNPFHIITDPATNTMTRPAPHLRYTVLSLARCHLDYADAEFTRDTDESIARARTLYLLAQRLLAIRQLQKVTPKNSPPEPALDLPDRVALQTRAQVQLRKLRQGRNIAGMPRVQGVPAGTGISQPTPYRYKTLLERAKQLIAQAAQVEAGYLAALEKYDAKTLQLVDAQNALTVAGAQVNLQAGRVTEANDAVTAAKTQQAKATTMASTYNTLIQAPPNAYESALLGEYGQQRDLQDVIAGADAAIGIAQIGSQAASIFGFFDSFGAKQGFAAVGTAGYIVKAGAQIWLNNIQSQMQANQLKAGIEQRKEEWGLQRSASQQDALVAAAQVTTATDGVTIASDELVIANNQQADAKATLQLLTSQFTSPDLYKWLSQTLGGVYTYFLQQATATARLAQAQLAFERAEPPKTFVQTDYTQMPAELLTNAKQSAPGLTGAERLAEDLDKVDQYAFSSDRRRLNVSQTFSLAQLMPVEFLNFRRTGTLSFATPASLFDNDFPGHYLRLINQVSVSLVALVPPNRGIRASLYSNGISRVTTQNDGTFQDVLLCHDPGVVALTSPLNASGVFTLDPQSDLLRPFEGQGVDTTWEFVLPSSANPFDFGSIADLLVTIDYSALYDGTYNSEVIDRFNANRTRGADCLFSLARDFPDQWYALTNPAPGAPRAATLSFRDIDFPLGIGELTTAAVAVRVAGDTTIPPNDITLQRVTTTGLSGAPGSITIGGTARTTDGIASTRRGNAADWAMLCQGTPVGDWHLLLGNTVDPLFTTGAINDVIVAFSWTGQAPAWT